MTATKTLLNTDKKKGLIRGLRNMHKKNIENLHKTEKVCYNLNMFKKYLEKVLSLIKANNKEITSTTQFVSSGIYMIYLEDFTDNKIIPFYIGQTHNFQNRHKQHFQEILSLNRLSYETYKQMFFYSENHKGCFYDGSFKSCKIFKYMIEHNLKLSQWHMIILEECDLNVLDEREQFYFDYLKPAFFGFNQLNTHIELFKALHEFGISNIPDDKIRQLLSIINKDINDIEKFYKYGFTEFNYLYSFAKGGINFSSTDLNIKEEVSIINNQIKQLNEKLKYQGEYTTNEYESLKNEHIILSQELEQSKENIRSSIQKFLKTNKIQASNIQTWLEDIVFYKSQTSKKLLDKYISKRLYKDKIYQLLENLISSYTPLIDKHSAQFDLYWEEKTKILKIRKENKDETLTLIFPNSYYSPFHLKDNYKLCKFDKFKDINNYCLINLYVSNNGRNKIPDLIKVDYFIDNNGNVVESYNNFIKSETAKLIQDNKVEYLEKDFVFPNLFRNKCYNIIPLNKKSDMIIDSQISILSEYKTGINDFTIQSNDLVYFYSVLRNIYKYVNEDTRYKVFVSEYNSTLDWALSRLGSKYYNDEFIQKLIKKKLFGLYDIKKEKPIKEKKVCTKTNPRPIINKVELWNSKILIKSENKISVLDYINAKLPLTAKCNVCNNIWKIRCDHLLDRTYCPKCRKFEKT